MYVSPLQPKQWGLTPTNMLTTTFSSPFASPFKYPFNEGGTSVSPEEAIRLALFGNNEQGAWYDPSDLFTMFQDAAGTTPVTAVGQPVGLILDKRLGLERGPELFVAPFGVSGGWTNNPDGSWSITSGAVNNDFSKNSAAPPGRYVEITYTLVTNNPLMVYEYSNSPVMQSSGTHRAMGVRSADDVGYLLFRVNTAGTTATVSNISVRELPGNHASQATAAKKPLLQQDGNGKYYLAFDGVDDGLNATFPAALGSSCTVVRAIPGVGAQILTAQTIGTTFADSTASNALLIVDRALTPQETADVTNWANDLAGV